MGIDSYGVDYGGLKAGLYIQRGGNIKAIDVSTGGSDSWLAALGLTQNVSASELANKEAWTYTAINRRSERIQGVPYSWMQGDNDIDKAPYEIKTHYLLSQLDKALQTQTDGAYLYKVRGLGKMLQRLIWLDPTTIMPDLDTATHSDGVKRFKRKKDNGQFEWIPAEELIWFRRAGQRELQSDPAPLEASRLSAEVLYNLARLEDFFYEGAGMPIMLVMINRIMTPADQTELKSRFERITNALRNPREIRVMAVSEGVTVEQLSFSPADLDLSGAEQRNRDKVLAVHQVPQSIAMSNAANYATALSDQIQFADTMATRLESIAEVFNADADFIADGYTLRVMRNEMAVNQEEESARSASVMNLVNAGETLENAYAILGYDLPEDYAAPVMVEAVEDKPDDEPEVKSGLWLTDRKAFKNWYKKRGADVDIDAFNSNELTYMDKLDVISEVNKDAGIYDWRNYP